MWLSTLWQCFNLVPRAFSSFKMAVGETPGQGCQSCSKNSLEFRPVNTTKCLRSVWTMVSDCRKQTGPPYDGNNLRKSHFIVCHVTKYSTILGVFQRPWPGVSPTAILNEEKALGTRLAVFFFNEKSKYNLIINNKLKQLYWRFNWFAFTGQVMEACYHQGQAWYLLLLCHSLPQPPLPSHPPGCEWWHHQGNLLAGPLSRLQMLVCTLDQVSKSSGNILVSN